LPSSRRPLFLSRRGSSPHLTSRYLIVPHPAEPSRTGARLGRAFLLYLVGVVAVVTLVPFDFGVPARIEILWGGELPDAVANVVVFLPLGFLFRLTWPSPEDRTALRPLLFGVTFSFLLELAQLFLPERYSSPFDVLANGAGAWLGALALDAVARRLRLTPALAGRLALELPLMGLVYLLVPLLWINALAGFRNPAPPLSTLLLGVLGAITLSQVYRHRFGPVAAVSIRRYALTGGAGFLAGAFALFLVQPVAMVACTAAVILVIAAWSGRAVMEGAERRYESNTLLLLTPLFAVYLVIAAGWSLPWSSAGPSPGPGFGSVAETTSILATLEVLAAFTVLGYGVAEYRGRREQRFWQTAAAVLPVSALVALGLELPAARQLTPASGAVHAVIAALASGYGSGIYHLQRAHIRHLLKGRY